jgi:phospholipase C
VITYDEHGGFYDSVAPGGVTAPNDGSSGSLNEYGFNFEQYGVRVPAIIISPLVTPGTVDHTVYDHSSVLATLESLFGLGTLTDRDANANNFIHLLTQPAASMESPTSLKGPNEAMKVEKTKMTPEELAANDLEPVPEQGNLPGFLHIMAKTEIEMSAGTPAEKEAIIARVRGIHTRGEAKAYINEVMAKVRAIKGDK